MKISVIIPCYNVEHFITDCIASIEKQTHKNLEVICIDDGSADGTLKMLEKLISTSPLSIKLINQKNNGAPTARNMGLRHSNGEYIQFLDADDMLTPHKIENQIQIVNKANFPDLIVGSYQRVNMKGEVLTTKEYNQNDCNNIWMNLMKTDLGNTCSNLFKSDLFKTGIKWNESLQSSQEYDLMFQILKRNANIVFDPEINTIIRQRDSGSISQQNIDQKWERYVRLRVDIMKYLKETNPSMINDDLIQFFFACIRRLYPHNSSKALSYFKEFFPKEFIPHVSSKNGKSYVILFKLFGFRNTERIRQYITKK